MNHFIEIRLLPDAEFAPTLLMNALYNKLHRALVEIKDLNIGISFPDYANDKKNPLGSRIRLHAKNEHLEKLMNINWLQGMRDHIRLGRIDPIPSNVENVIFKRVQCNTNVDRIRRRQMKRKNITYEQAVMLIPELPKKSLALPFVNLKSKSTEQSFRLFIKREAVPAAINEGGFNTYGLSLGSTVPLF